MSSHTLQASIAVVVALAVVALFFVFANPLAMPGQNGSDLQNKLGNTDSSAAGQGSQNLVIQDETVGTGDIAQAGDTLAVNYTGRLQDGTVFDTSVGKKPFTFALGAGQVIAGWDQGLAGMKVGGKRLLIIPSSLAYGAQQVGSIPPNSTLVFEVELLSVQAAPSSSR